MYQGTTPTHTFNLSISTSLIKDITITYIQNRKIVLVKTLKDCTITDNALQLELAQQETMKFSHLAKIRIELKALTTDKKVIASVIDAVSVKELINKEVFDI